MNYITVEVLIFGQRNSPEIMSSIKSGDLVCSYFKGCVLKINYFLVNKNDKCNNDKKICILFKSNYKKSKN